MRVGIALSTFDGAAHLPAQLTSLVDQTRLPDVLVIRDDGSTDGTPELLQAFEQTAPFPVRLLAAGSRLGSTRSFEQVLDALRGDVDVVLLCDQDDVWHGDKVARLLAALAAEPQTLLASSDARLVDEDGAPLGGTAWQTVGLDAERQARLGSPDAALPLLLSRSLLTGMTMAFRGRLLDVALPFPDAVRDASVSELIHDRWLSLVAAAFGPVTSVPQPLADYRRHGRQQLGLWVTPEGTDRPASLIDRLSRLRDPDLGWQVEDELAAARARAAVLREHLAARHLAASAVQRLDVELRHLDAVLELPVEARGRLPFLLRELRAGGYASRGRRAMLDDLLRRRAP